jgi:predicted branched-subunit amino acid permease
VTPPEPRTTLAGRTQARAALREGVRDTLLGPFYVLGASYLGFGSMIRESGWGLDAGLLSTFLAWALPGQVTMVELHVSGASLLVIVVAVSLANVRLMPMVVSILPLLTSPGQPRWRLYAAAYLVAVTGWAMAMVRCPSLPAPMRWPYFVGAASSLWLASMVGTALGFIVAGMVPKAVSLGLVFLNPIYFMLLFLVDLRQRQRILALGFGAALSVPAHWLSPEWGLLLAGLIGGTAAILLDRGAPRSHV